MDGPASWDEVDTEELERIAVNILRSVVPSTENLEVGARLAMQVGPTELVHASDRSSSWYWSELTCYAELKEPHTRHGELRLRP